MRNFCRILLGVIVITGVLAKDNELVSLGRNNSFSPPWQEAPEQKTLEQGSGSSFTPQDQDDHKKKNGLPYMEQTQLICSGCCLFYII